jgi:hypothetical protein
MELLIASASHRIFAKEIADCIAASAAVRGTGIARRTPEYIITKMENGNAIIALDNKKFVGFCYIEVWGHGNYVAHSGLIVNEDYRGQGIAKKIKKKTLALSLSKFPDAKIFGITTGKAVLKINTDLGYKPVHFSENYDVLTRTSRTMCLCTGMLYDPKRGATNTKKTVKVATHLQSIKNQFFLKKTK